MSDSIVALDLTTGRIRWAYQATKRDAWNVACEFKTISPNCPAEDGPDYDFGAGPVLSTDRNGQDVVLASYLTAARWVEAGLLAARPFAEAQLQQRRLQVLALEGRVPSAMVQQFTQTLVAAIEQYGKRKVGRRKAREGQPGALPQP